MTLHAINVNIGASLGEGRYVPSIVNSTMPGVSTGTLSTDNAATLTAINAMGALTGYGALTGAAAALAAAQAAKATVDTDIAALTTATGADVSVIWDTTHITTRNALKEALRKVLHAIDGGYGGLAQ